MKITIAYSEKERHAAIETAHTIGMCEREVNDMINDFEIGGRNLTIKHSYMNKSLEVELNEITFTRLLRRVNPIIDMIRASIKVIKGFFADMDEEFEGVEVISCLSKSDEEKKKQQETEASSKENQ